MRLNECPFNVKLTRPGSSSTYFIILYYISPYGHIVYKTDSDTLREGEESGFADWEVLETPEEKYQALQENHGLLRLDYMRLHSLGEDLVSSIINACWVDYQGENNLNRPTTHMKEAISKWKREKIRD